MRELGPRADELMRMRLIQTTIGMVAIEQGITTDQLQMTTCDIAKRVFPLIRQGRRGALSDVDLMAELLIAELNMDSATCQRVVDRLGFRVDELLRLNSVRDEAIRRAIVAGCDITKVEEAGKRIRVRIEPFIQAEEKKFEN